MKRDDIFLKSVKFHKTVNAMTTSAEKAPYLGTVEPTGIVDTDAFVQVMIDEEGCTESKESILRAIQCRDNAIMTCVGEQQMKVYTGDGSLVSPFIYGSFDAPDAAVGPNNSVEPQIRLGAEIRDAVADIIPEEDRSAISELGGVRILSVMTDGIGFGLIKGTQPFCIAGIGFKPSDTSTVAVSLTSQKTGASTAATVVAVDSTQRIKAKMPTPPTAGGYQLTVTVTDGSGEETRTYPAQKNVTVLASDEPAPAKPKVTISNGSADDNAVMFEIENAEAVRGYAVDQYDVKSFKVDLWKNGELNEEDAEAIWTPAAVPYVSKPDFAAAGDVIKIVAHVDPAKTGYDQSDAVHQFTVG